jgi:hypothetical protein
MKYLAIIVIVLSSTMPWLARKQRDTSSGLPPQFTAVVPDSSTTTRGGGSGTRLIGAAFHPSHARMNSQDTQK